MQRARPSDEGRVKRGQGREMEERDRGLMPEGAESYAKPFSATCIRQ